MKMLKRTGPRMEPYGIPLVTEHQPDVTLFLSYHSIYSLIILCFFQRHILVAEWLSFLVCAGKLPKKIGAGAKKLHHQALDVDVHLEGGIRQFNDHGIRYFNDYVTLTVFR